MEREFVELFEAAKKAADSAAVGGAPAEEGRCLDALKNLKNFPVDYQLLASTQVGKRLRNLTKHPKRKIQGLASDLLQLWKSIVMEESTKNNKNGSLSTNNLINVESASMETEKAHKTQKMTSVKPNNVKVEAVNAEKKVENVSIVKIEKTDSAKSSNIEKIDKEEEKPGSVLKKFALIKCNDAFRDKVREILLEALSKVPSEVDEAMRDEVNVCDPTRVSVSVESALFEKWGRSNGTQKNKYRSIMFNMKDANNPDFRRKVLLGNFKPDDLPSLSPEEMASDQRQQQNKQIKEKAMFECERGGPPKATTDQFKCGRCGQRKCTYHQMQTRSADEPMTTFVTCVNCNNHWKFC